MSFRSWLEDYYRYAQDRASEPGLVRQAVNSLTGLPHDVYTGRKRVGDLTPSDTLGYASQFIAPGMASAEGNSLGIFGGRMGAKRAGRELTSVGKDTKPRFEIDDSKSTMKAEPFYLDEVWKHGTARAPRSGQEIPWSRREHPLPRLGDVLDHPELYAAYPDMANIRLMKSGTGGGYYNHENNIIALPGNGAKDKSVLMHELSHAVAAREGHDLGANPVVWGKYKDAAQRGVESAQLIDKRLNALYEKVGPRDAKDTPYGSEIKQLLDARKKVAELANSLNRRPVQKYMSNAGETEARNVQTRMDWDAQKRSYVLPELSEDVWRSKQTLGDLLRRY